MKILYLVPNVPSLIRVRPYNLIKKLASRGHQLTVLTLWSSLEDKQDLSRFTDECYQVKGVYLSRLRSLVNCLLAVPSRIPLQAVFCWQPQLSGELIALAQQSGGGPAYDILHVEHLRGARYGLAIKLRKEKALQQLPIVWDSVDSIGLLFKQAAVQSKSRFSRWLSYFESRRTERYERWLVGQFDRVLITSEQDRQAILQGSPAGPANPGAVTVLPNGVDLDYFAPDPAVQRDPATLVISGKMSYHANVAMVLHLVREIMPLVWRERPDVKLNVVGKAPPREVRALGQNPAVQVTGAVDDIRPFLQEATLSVTPILYGAGIQNKVLEAMACATPVISTPQAISALSAKPGRDVLIAQEPPEFARQVLQALDEPGRRMELGLAGRRYVEAHHDWNQIAAQLEQIYLQCIAAKVGSESLVSINY